MQIFQTSIEHIQEQCVLAYDQVAAYHYSTVSTKSDAIILPRCGYSYIVL